MLKYHRIIIQAMSKNPIGLDDLLKVSKIIDLLLILSVKKPIPNLFFFSEIW